MALIYGDYDNDNIGWRNVIHGDYDSDDDKTRIHGMDELKKKKNRDK